MALKTLKVYFRFRAPGTWQRIHEEFRYLCAAAVL